MDPEGQRTNSQNSEWNYPLPIHPHTGFICAAWKDSKVFDDIELAGFSLDMAGLRMDGVTFTDFGAALQKKRFRSSQFGME
jgi:hypothetical protein